MPYNYSKNLRLPFEEVVDRTRDNLRDHGFNVIHTIDVKEDLMENLNIRFRNYVILTACHSALSYKAISLERHIGLILPCNVLIQEHENGAVEVSALNPMEALDPNMITPSLELVALELSDHLRTAVDALQNKPVLEFSYS